MTKKKITFSVILIFVVMISGCTRSNYCDLVATGLEGVVLEKNYSPQHKRARSVTVRYEGKSEGFALGDVDEDFYNIIEVGDSLYKREHSRDVTIFRGNLEIKAELQCGLQ